MTLPHKQPFSVGQSCHYRDGRHGPALRVTQVNGDSCDLVTANGECALQRVPFEHLDAIRLGDLPKASKRVFFRLIDGAKL